MGNADCTCLSIRRVLVKRDELTLEGIKQFFVAVEKVNRSASVSLRK